jgi:hypothetical protein
MRAPLLSDVSDRYGRFGDLDSQDSASQAFLQCLLHSRQTFTSPNPPRDPSDHPQDLVPLSRTPLPSPSRLWSDRPQHRSHRHHSKPLCNVSTSRAPRNTIANVSFEFENGPDCVLALQIDRCRACGVDETIHALSPLVSGLARQGVRDSACMPLAQVGSTCSARGVSFLVEQARQTLTDLRGIQVLSGRLEKLSTGITWYVGQIAKIDGMGHWRSR